MKQPRSHAVPAFRAPVSTTKRGRRFVVCPGCQVITAGVSAGGARLTCAHCGTEFELTEGSAKRAP